MHAARGAAALAGVDANEQRSRLHDGDPAQRSSCPDSSLLNFGEALLAGKTPRTP